MITVVGSLNMDLVIYCDKVPKIGETIMGRDFRTYIEPCTCTGFSHTQNLYPALSIVIRSLPLNFFKYLVKGLVIRKTHFKRNINNFLIGCLK